MPTEDNVPLSIEDQIQKLSVFVREQLLKRQDLVALVQTSLARIRMMDRRVVPPWR
jgi:hypothetical protein